MTSPLTPYGEWLVSQAKAIKSDGCSRVADINLVCCYEHDLGYYYGRDPREAYRLVPQSGPASWSLAAKISRSEVDARFRDCNLKMDPVWFDGDAYLRWVGVRLGGWWAWRKHRKVRP